MVLGIIDSQWKLLGEVDGVAFSFELCFSDSCLDLGGSLKKWTRVIMSRFLFLRACIYARCVIRGTRTPVRSASYWKWIRKYKCSYYCALHM